MGPTVDDRQGADQAVGVASPRMARSLNGLDGPSAEVLDVRGEVGAGFEVGDGEPLPGVGGSLVAADRVDTPAVALGEVDEVDVLVGDAAVVVDVDVL